VFRAGGAGAIVGGNAERLAYGTRAAWVLKSHGGGKIDPNGHDPREGCCMFRSSVVRAVSGRVGLVATVVLVLPQMACGGGGDPHCVVWPRIK